MRASPFTLPLIAALIAPLALTACQQDKQLYVDQAWISAGASPDMPAAGYFTVHAGSKPVTLRAVDSNVTQRIVMHDSVMENGMMTMKPIDSVDIAAGKKISFAPGGRHLMIYGLNPGAVEMGKAALTFIFSNGDRIIVDARIEKQGTAAPAMTGMAHEGHEGDSASGAKSK